MIVWIGVVMLMVVFVYFGCLGDDNCDGVVVG